jgi:hypothetical protein
MWTRTAPLRSYLGIKALTCLAHVSTIRLNRFAYRHSGSSRRSTGRAGWVAIGLSRGAARRRAVLSSTGGYELRVSTIGGMT